MDIYKKLGVRRVINASANNSHLGSCISPPEVLEAMQHASSWFVDMEQLQRQAGKYISKITSAEDGLVTSGATCGLLLGTAACITGDDRAKMLSLPGAATAEVVIPKGQLTGYHQAIRTAGAKLIETGLPYRVSREEISAAINENTVALCYTFGEVTSKIGMVSLFEMIEVGRKHKIPVLVDASVASYPPSRLREHIEEGADLVAFSGAKHIYGPPGTGFICGRKDLINACRLQAGPAYGIGRPCKVSKEEIAGLIKALDLYIQRDIPAELKMWEERVAELIDLLAPLPYLEVQRVFPDEVGRPVPRVEIKLDEKGIGFSAKELELKLRNRDPSIRIQWFLLDIGIVYLNPLGLLEGDIEHVSKAFFDIWREEGINL